MKDTLELLQKHPGYFGGIDYSESHVRRPWKINIIFAQPRSGSTLLLRLLNIACLTYTLGDKPTDFYKSCISLYRNYKMGQTGDIAKAETEGVFMDCYNGSSEGAARYKFSFGMRYILFGHTYSSAMKTTSIGFGNDLLPEMLELIDYITQQRPEEFDVRICYLTRDHDEIIKSASSAGSLVHEGIYREYLTQQLEQFREHRELGEPWIKFP